MQVRTSKEEKKGGSQRDILNLKLRTIRSLSVCLSGFMYVSEYVFLYIYNIVEVVNEF